MVKNRNIVGGVSSHLISFRPQKKSKMRAFSIAEAMITLTIFAVIAASTAPLISKQIKNNTLGDIAFSTLNQKTEVLNKKTEELNKTKWYQTPDKKSVTRPEDNVGIGVSAGTNPSAKLDIRNNDKNLIGLSVISPVSLNSPIMLVRKGNVTQFGVADTGRTLVQNGMSMHTPLETGINYLTTWKSSDEQTGDAAQSFRQVLARDGSIWTHAGGTYAMVLKNDDNKNLLVSNTNGAFAVGYRKIGTNENHPRFYINKYGVVTISAPTREETNPDDPDNDKRNDARALSILYPEDSSADLDCAEYDSVGNCITPRTDNGITETAFFNSVGSLYINSLIHGFHNEAIAVRNGSVYRAWIRTDGQVNIAVSDAAPDGKALVIKESMAKNFTENAWIKRDGSAWFKGNVTVDGTIANAELDTKFAKINNDLSNAKELIAELKLENADIKAENKELKEKLASFEFQLAEIIAINNLQKIAQKK